jgi:glycosyltransferase involved in cell wall biosynthesis
MQKPQRLPLSVCLISGAEAHRIGAALESVADWAAEIIVVLNEDVVDGTEALAQKHGAKVFREPWKGFVGQKNSAAEKASSNWILNLDADEVLSPELKKEISSVLAEEGGGGRHAAYEFPRCTFYCGRWIRHGDWYPDRVMRLWQRGKARWIGEEPHARLEVDGAVGRLRSDLLHHSNESIDRQISKIGPYHEHFVDRMRKQARTTGLLDLTFRPWWRFVRAYCFRLGFLDGWQGFYIARLSAFSTLTKYALLREREENDSRAVGRAHR